MAPELESFGFHFMTCLRDCHNLSRIFCRQLVLSVAVAIGLTEHAAQECDCSGYARHGTRSKGDAPEPAITEEWD